MSSKRDCIQCPKSMSRNLTIMQHPATISFEALKFHTPPDSKSGDINEVLKMKYVTKFFLFLAPTEAVGVTLSFCLSVQDKFVYSS